MSVSTNSDFFLEFMEPLIGGIWDLIKGIGNALIRIFNIANYIDIINNHSGVSPLIVAISIISLLIYLLVSNNFQYSCYYSAKI